MDRIAVLARLLVAVAVLGACGQGGATELGLVEVSGAAWALRGPDSGQIVARSRAGSLGDEVVVMRGGREDVAARGWFIQDMVLNDDSIVVLESLSEEEDVVIKIGLQSLEAEQLLAFRRDEIGVVSVALSEDGRHLAAVVRVNPQLDGPAQVKVFDLVEESWTDVVLPDEATTGTGVRFDGGQLFIGIPADRSCSVFAVPVAAWDAADCVVERADLSVVLQGEPGELVWLLDVCDGQPVLAVNIPQKSPDFTPALVSQNGDVTVGASVRGQFPTFSCEYGGVAMIAAGTGQARLQLFEVDEAASGTDQYGIVL